MSSPKAPYIPFSTFTRILDDLSNSEIPEIRNGTSLSGMKISDNEKWLFMPTLKFFDLIDSNHNPTEQFRELITNKEERKRILLDLFKSHYSALFEKDLKTISRDEFNAVLAEQYGVQGGILRKSARFFIKGCQELEIPISDDLTQKNRSQEDLASANGTKNQSLFESKVESVEIPEESAEISKETNTEVEKKMQQEVTQQNEQVAINGRNSAFVKSINLKSGGKLALTAEVDIWQLEREDRELVFRMVDEMKSYEKIRE